MRTAMWAVPAMLAGVQVAALAQPMDEVTRGTEITVRTNDWINSNRADGRIYTGAVDRDILDRDGHVAIPRGAQVELLARRYGDNDLALDLESINDGGRRYVVAASDAELHGGDRAGVGGNERTAKYVGGGAIIGSIIGAIAGGGKGAAIGAGVGAAGGAGAQMATRGREIHVPPESVLTFRLERDIHLTNDPDRGHMRDGYHYHD